MDHQEYNKLIEKIDYHMNLYYNMDNPQISDYEYDQLMIELKKIEKEHPDWITPESPTQKIGGVAKREAGIKIRHDVPMLSIEDVFSKEEVISWIKKVKLVHPDASFSVETKIDGLSVTLRYKKDQNNVLTLVMAETRGDGYEGEDVTLNALAISDVKKYIDLPYDSLQIRGEVYMSHLDFNRFNEEQEKLGKKLAANPRNLAAGTLRQLDSAITKKRGLRMSIFNIQSGPNEIRNFHSKGLDILKNKKVPVVYHQVCNTEDEVIKVIDDIANMRSELDYDIDGAVIKINQAQYRDDFTSGSKYSAGHIAYKYPPEERVIVMNDILVDVGRTGKLTFTGVFFDKETKKATKLCGTKVTRATLHNQDYINEMSVGIGGSYRLFKSGEIIPKLNGCIEKPQKVFQAPNYCPVCGEKLYADDASADIICYNSLCPAQLTRTISYFCSNDAMNIIGLGDSIIDILVKRGYVETFADIYSLKEKRSELIKNGLIGKEKNTDKILSAIEFSKNNGPVKLLTGLGIRNVGKNTAKSIMRHFNSINELKNASFDDFITIEDIGEITAFCLKQYFEEDKNLKVLSELEAAGVVMTMRKPVLTDEKLAGLIFVVTGTLSHFGRKEIKELIESSGGKCTSSVSSKTDFLILGEDPGRKYTKAQALNINIITEDEFLNILNGDS